MEENKEIKKEAKLDYDKLNAIAHQLSEQNNQLYSQLKTLNNIFKRLDYLFKVVENAPVFEEEFLDGCIKEIQELMTPEEETKEETETTSTGEEND
jgi:hypothetical protein